MGPVMEAFHGGDYSQLDQGQRDSQEVTQMPLDSTRSYEGTMNHCHSCRVCATEIRAETQALHEEGMSDHEDYCGT